MKKKRNLQCRQKQRSDQFPAPDSCYGVLYRVQSGETLYIIGQRFGISLEAILAANPQIVDPDQIFPGQIICLPTGEPQCPQGFIYNVQPGDTLFSIAEQFGIDLQKLIDANPQIPDTDLIAVGQPICIPVPVPPDEKRVYTTGPLAIDPEIQIYVGVIVENQTNDEIDAKIWLINKEPCPKTVANLIQITIPASCSFNFAFDIWSFFYEVIVQVPEAREVNITIYGLTYNFKPIAANTLKHTELKMISTPPKTTITPKKISTDEIATAKNKWFKKPGDI